MKTLLFSFLFLSGLSAFAQQSDMAVLTTNQTETIKTKTKKLAFRPNVERPAYFQGGKTALVDYVSNHVIYPELALENAHEGIVIVEFTVQKNGSIKNAKIVKSLGFGCDEVALVLVKNMPKWQAAQQGERAVKSRVRLPLAFYL